MSFLLNFQGEANNCSSNSSQPLASVPSRFPSFCLLASCVGFSFSTFSGAEEQNKKKSKLIVVQYYTQHSWRECKDLGPNRTIKRKQNEEQVRVCAKHLGSAGETSTESKRHKTKSACSPQANIVYIAVHAKSMN